MKIAQFRNALHGYDVVLTEEDKKYRRDVVQISAYVDVDFPPLAPDVDQQTEFLNIAEQELRAQFQTKLDQIAAERAKLQGAQS